MNKTEKIVKEHGKEYLVRHMPSCHTEFWYLNDNHFISHREEGPALICKGIDHKKCPSGFLLYAWYQHGQKHREDGPAYITHLGTVKYVLNGESYINRQKFLEELDKQGKLIYINDKPHLIDGRLIKES